MNLSSFSLKANFPATKKYTLNVIRFIISGWRVLDSSGILKFERARLPIINVRQSENFTEAQRATLGRASGAARDKTRQDPLKLGNL